MNIKSNVSRILIEMYHEWALKMKLFTNSGDFEADSKSLLFFDLLKIDSLPVQLGGLLLFYYYWKFLFCGWEEGVRLLISNKKLVWQRLLIDFKKKMLCGHINTCNTISNIIICVVCITQVPSTYLMSVLRPAITPMNNFCCSYSSPSK